MERYKDIEKVSANVLRELKEETVILRTLVKDYEELQRSMAEARKETTEYAMELGLEENVSKNHPSVISYLTGYTKGRTTILETLKKMSDEVL